MQSDRNFGLMFAVVFLIAFGVAWFGFGKRLDSLVWIAFAFAALALTIPWLLLPLNRLWQRFAYVLGMVNNRLILGAFFYLFIGPVGFILRRAGRDPMQRHIDPRAASYWRPVNRQPDSENFKDLF